MMDVRMNQRELTTESMRTRDSIMRFYDNSRISFIVIGWRKGWKQCRGILGCFLRGGLDRIR